MDRVNHKMVNLFELLGCLTHAADLVSPKLANHHQQVAYLSYMIAGQLKLPVEQRKKPGPGRIAARRGRAVTGRPS